MHHDMREPDDEVVSLANYVLYHRVVKLDFSIHRSLFVEPES